MVIIGGGDHDPGSSLSSEGRNYKDDLIGQIKLLTYVWPHTKLRFLIKSIRAQSESKSLTIIEAILLSIIGRFKIPVYTCSMLHEAVTMTIFSLLKQLHTTSYNTLILYK